MPHELWWDNPRTVAPHLLTGRDRRLLLAGDLSLKIAPLVQPTVVANNMFGPFGPGFASNGPITGMQNQTGFG